MLQEILGGLWRRAPKFMRRWSVRLTQPRFTVTAGAVVVDSENRVLLLRHVFRAREAWGIPGGFIKKGENPDEAVRRELREETGLELESAEIAFARTLRRAGQVEIIFRCRPAGAARARSVEIKSASWFPLNSLPSELAQDQRRLIERALADGTNGGV